MIDEMRIAAVAVVALLLGVILSPALMRPQAGIAAEKGIDVYFSPDGGAQDAIVAAIKGAKKSLDVQAYFFTNSTISKAVIEAHARKVKVRVLLDHSQRSTKYSSATPLFNAGVPVFIDAQHETMHNKVMLIDGQTLITGSFNFTRAAETSNAENVLVIRDHPRLFAAYQKNFDEHLKHCEKYNGIEKN